VVADDSHKVEDEEGGRVARFYEKPKEFVTNRVNAGLYIFNKSIIDTIDLKPHFLERDIFPKLAE
jgi:mannose-1-phosphate guanylyltransferase